MAACLAEFVESRELVVGDMGYGAGFPGVPIAVSRPDRRVTLISLTDERLFFSPKRADDSVILPWYPVGLKMSPKN